MYAKVENGSISAYPYGMSDLRKDHPSTSFPLDSLSREDIRVSYGVMEVVSSGRPLREGHLSEEATPELVNGAWTQKWNTVLKNPEQVEEQELHPQVVIGIVPKQDGKITIQGAPEWDGSQWNRTWEFIDGDWLQLRVDAYGSAESQIEFITENGLEAWQAKVAEIKTKYPKS